MKIIRLKVASPAVVFVMAILGFYRIICGTEQVAEQKTDERREGEYQHPVQGVADGTGENVPATRATRLAAFGQRTDVYQQVTFVTDDPDV